MIWLRENLSGDKFHNQYEKLIKKCREIISGNIRVLSGEWKSEKFNYGVR